jgi:hypothetical protein
VKEKVTEALQHEANAIPKIPVDDGFEDALIVRMMGRIGFSNGEYARRQHGGYLGAKSRRQARSVS